MGKVWQERRRTTSRAAADGVRAPVPLALSQMGGRGALAADRLMPMIMGGGQVPAALETVADVR